ncbi:MAG: multicopper oxidase domain-containing protein, partial [Chromatiales bacterium]|nr:multicopper oxidase domain-containing protein [Chromatiales bacterium]
MKITRRDLIARSGLAGAAALAGVSVAPKAEAATRYKHWEHSYSGGAVDVPAKPPVQPGKGYRPVTVPNGATLPFRIVNGVKVFHLTVDEVFHQIAPGIKAHMWGYGGRVNSTVIEAVEGERVRIYVTNRLKVPTTVHWHGLFLPNGMDGVAGVTQPPIPPGETWRYEWTLRQHGTFMYHSHFDAMTQEGMGLSGMFIVHPRNPEPEDRVDRDFVLLMNEYKIEPGTWRPDPNEMTDFN